jgi:hypothetical protein
MTLARIDEVDTAVRRSTLSVPLLAVDMDEKLLDRKRARVQRNLKVNRLRPTVRRQPARPFMLSLPRRLRDR